MKILFIIFFIFLSNLSISQNNTDITIFAQAYFSIDDFKQLKELEKKIKENPNVKLVRLDFPSQRCFILTKNIENLSESQLKSWFENYSETINCIQIGVYGLDKINPYPFKCDERK